MKKNIRIVYVLTASALLTLTSACSTSSDLGKSSSALPVESSSSIASARVAQKGGTVYVTGAAKPIQNRPQTLAAHVDVELIGRQGQVIASARDSITASHPRTVQGHLGRYPYTVSFPITQVEQAGKVVVTYHSSAHGS